jgi:predicted permease
MPDRGPRQVVAAGVGLALAVAVPAALLAQVVDAVSDDDPGLLAYPLALVVLAGMAAGGDLVGRRASQAPARLGAITGLVAIAVVQALGIARRAVAGDDIAWATVPAVTVVAVLLAAGAAARRARQAGRTRP